MDIKKLWIFLFVFLLPSFIILTIAVSRRIPFSSHPIIFLFLFIIGVAPFISYRFARYIEVSLEGKIQLDNFPLYIFIIEIGFLSILLNFSALFILKLTGGVFPIIFPIVVGSFYGVVRVLGK